MKFILKYSVCFVLTMCLALPLVSCAGDKEAKKEALKSAESWLKLVDNGEYGQSWEDASNLFQQAITKEAWITTIKGVRPPLGKVESRKLESAAYATQLPGAPDGEYVVIQFNTVFENKANAVETITPMKDPDGSWKVSGYYIK